MGKIGGGNPIPFEIGGGPSSSEAAYNAMRSAVGIGGAAEDGTIEAAWRMARARGLRAAFCEGRVAAQYFPDRCTDSIPAFEEILELAPSPDASDEARRQDVLDRWIDSSDYSTSGIEDRLQEIDSRFSIIDNDRDTATITQYGRAFEDWDPTDGDACGPDFGGRDCSDWPGYSSDFNCIVMFALDAGAITGAARKKIERAKDLLNRLLPSWVDFMFTRTTDGFTLDTDLLDLEGMGS